jgi:hypothetical protein
MTRGGYGLLLGALVALAAPVALGQTTDVPDERVREAAEAYDRGEFDRALDLLQAAYAETSKPALLFNMAQVQRSKNDCATAAATYRRFLDTTTSDDPNRQRAQRYESDMLACAARAAASPAPEPHVPGPATAPIPPLTPRSAEAGASSPGLQVTHPISPPPDQPEPTWTPRKITAYALVGAGIIAAGAGGVMALRARSTFHSQSSTEHYDRRDRLGNEQQQKARILGGAAAVIAGTGVTLLLF